MSQLIIKSTERRPSDPAASLSGAHLWGDVIDILPDHSQTDHYVPDPFLVVSVPLTRGELEFLLEPLTGQTIVVDEGGIDRGPDSLLRKRYGLNIERLPDTNRLQLCATGKTKVTEAVLSSIIDCRSV